jgi:hypothetical protein
MLESFTHATFAPLLGEVFRLQLDENRVLDLRLSTATELGDKSWQVPERDGMRQPFSLLFIGPPDILLPQRIYRLENATLGALEMFLVPIGRDAQGVQYEAIFA